MKKLSIFLVFVMLIQMFAFPVCASTQGTSIGDLEGSNKPSVTAKSAILMDANSGEILYSKNINSKRYPASITKIMTTLVAIENCESLYETVTYSENAINSIEPGSSQIYILPGEKLSLEESLYAIMLESANEACNGVAEHIGSSIEGFVDMMNEKAQELGCKNTHFMNPNGLHDDKHYVTAYDMALITKAALENETFRKIASTVSYTIPSTNKQKDQRPLWNHHKMVKKTMYVYDGVEGGKTGFTMMARNTLVTWAERDGMELICVTLKDNGYETYNDTVKLFNYGFNNFKADTPFTDMEEIKTTSDSEDLIIKTGNQLTPYKVSTDIDTSYSVVADKDTDFSKIERKISYNEKKKTNVLNLYYEDEKIGSVPFSMKVTTN
ncbi:MAG: D-alanyl-D-alanine carboxypeptidase family protein [Lachnospiraceae bacterium]|nr:D-alanyl-D-alanine carboxypeptidase family protein [Lachnospiraceae bacterium]